MKWEIIIKVLGLLIFVFILAVANAVLCGTGKIVNLGAIICFYEPVAYLI